MAKPGHMGLAPMFDDGGQVIDFTWREASPTSTLAFGCAGEDSVGRMLKQVLVECAMDASVFASYRTVLLRSGHRFFASMARMGWPCTAFRPCLAA
jgi:hypothetical protein